VRSFGSRRRSVMPRSGRPRAMGNKNFPCTTSGDLPGRQFEAHRTDLESQIDLFRSQSALYSPVPAPQQSTIATTHERQTRLDQANGAIADIMGLPASFRNLAGPKQPFRYRAIAVSFDVAIKRSYRERKPLAALKREAGMRPCERPPPDG